MELIIRRILSEDARHILHIDQNSCEFSWEPEDWFFLEDHYNPWSDYVITVDGVLKAYAIFDFDKESDTCRLFRYCIHRDVDDDTAGGIDMKLLEKIEHTCFERGLGNIEIDVCETEILGSTDPYDRSVWLKRHGFKMTRTESGLENRYYKPLDVLYFTKVVEDRKFV